MVITWNMEVICMMSLSHQMVVQRRHNESNFRVQNMGNVVYMTTQCTPPLNVRHFGKNTGVFC